MPNSRRRWLTTLGLGAVVSLAGCGFALRQNTRFAFKTLYPQFSDSGALGVALRRQLLGTGSIEVLTDPQQLPKADVILEVLGERREQVAVGISATGQVRELQLRLSVRFQLRTPQGESLIDAVEVQQQRDLSFSETAALSKEIEQDILYRDMQDALVQQIMRRLSAVKLKQNAAATAPATLTADPVPVPQGPATGGATPSVKP